MKLSKTRSLENIDVSKACGPVRGIPWRLLKAVAFTGLDFYRCLGKVAWERALITPILTNSDPHAATNYRAISLLG